MIIKTIVALILLGIMTSNKGHGYDKYKITGAHDTAKIIEQIKAQYKIVNVNQAKYRLLEKDLMGESSEGGFIAAYDDQKDLRKLIVTYYGETGKATTEYYFDHNDLFFAYVKQYNYDKPIGQPDSKIESVKENRYYFYNKKLIHWVQNTANQRFNSTVANAKARKLLSESKRLSGYIFNCNSVPINPVIRDTLRCKYGSDCPSTGYILNNSRNSCGEAIHVRPKNKKVQLER